MDTSYFADLNWLAIGAATVAYFMLGALWYSKMLFGNQWIKGTGINVDDPNVRKGVGGVMLSTFLMEAIICIGLAILAYKMMLIGGVMSGIKLGLLTGGTFCAMVIFISYLYQSKIKTLGFIDAGYHLVGNVIAAIIICAW